MNNKIVNLALLAENAGKLDKSKTNINNLFMEIKKIVDYLNADDEGDFKEKRQEFLDALSPIVSKIDDILENICLIVDKKEDSIFCVPINKEDYENIFNFGKNSDYNLYKDEVFYI